VPTKAPKSPQPGLLSRTAAKVGELGADGVLTLCSRLLTALIVVVLIGSWAFGRSRLERYVSSLSTQPPKVSIEWPTIPDPSGNGERTWVPVGVQNELEQLVLANVTPDPFDQESLQTAADRLKWTGWFAQLKEVRREAGGVVAVRGAWRVPAAVVKRDGRNHLVAMDGAVLKLPSGAEPPPGLFSITNPTSPAPTTDRGGLAYGKPWVGGDVQSAIALLKVLHGRPKVARQVAGVDLSEFAKSAKLTLVTDKGNRIVWGSPIGETLPGEVLVERKIARLEQNLKDFGRIDADQGRVEIYTPVVLVDKTARDETVN